MFQNLVGATSGSRMGLTVPNIDSTYEKRELYTANDAAEANDVIILYIFMYKKCLIIKLFLYVKRASKCKIIMNSYSTSN